MASTMEKISTINSFLRTLLAIVVLGVVGFAGLLGYQKFNKNEIAARQSAEKLAEANGKLEAANKNLEIATADLMAKGEQIAQQQVQIETLSRDIERLETSLALMKVDHRLAKLTVTDQGIDQSTGEPFSLVEFVERRPRLYRQLAGEVRRQVCRGSRPRTRHLADFVPPHLRR
jgi:cell division protein FtsB